MTETLGDAALVPLVGGIVQTIVAAFRSAYRLPSGRTLFLVFGLAQAITALVQYGAWATASPRPEPVSLVANTLLTGLGAATFAITNTELLRRDKKRAGRS
jgi:hypothetical protein